MGSLRLGAGVWTGGTGRTGATPLGTLLDYQTFPNLTNWTQSGSVIAASGGNLLLTATNSVFTNYITEDAYGYSCLEAFEITSEFTVTEKSATSNGFGIGLRDGTGTTVYNLCRFSTNSGVTGGKLDMFLQNASSATATSASAISFSVNDRMRLTFGRRNASGADQYYAQIDNITTGAASVTLTYDVSYVSPLTGGINASGTWKYTLYAFRGTLTVHTFKVTSTARARCKTLFVGDSITRGLYATTRALRFANVINPSTFEVCGGPGDRSSDIVNRINELVDLRPRYMVLSIGTNDLAASVSVSTIMANIATIVSAMNAVGTTVYVCHQLPRTGVTVTTLNSNIASTYPSNDIDIYTPMQTAGAPTPALFDADLLHPNQSGHATIASTISTAFPNII